MRSKLRTIGLNEWIVVVLIVTMAYARIIPDSPLSCDIKTSTHVTLSVLLVAISTERHGSD